MALIVVRPAFHWTEEHDVRAVVEWRVSLGQFAVEGERHVRIRFDADRCQKVAERRVSRKTIRLRPIGALRKESAQVGEKRDGHADGPDV
jgi:hypothetical protein